MCGPLIRHNVSHSFYSIISIIFPLFTISFDDCIVFVGWTWSRAHEPLQQIHVPNNVPNVHFLRHMKYKTQRYSHIVYLVNCETNSLSCVSQTRTQINMTTQRIESYLCAVCCNRNGFLFWAGLILLTIICGGSVSKVKSWP